MNWRRAFFLAALASIADMAIAAGYKTVALSGGATIEYALVLPERFEADQPYPAILAFAGGRQSIGAVRGTLERFWETQARSRGYIVVAPAAPPGMPYFRAGADLVPEFLDRALAPYRIKDGELHVAGHSNGAVSAFRVAIRNPHRFRSVIAVAGHPDFSEDFSSLHRMAHLNVIMFVGALDTNWMRGMQRTKARLESLGGKIYLEIVPGNGHFLPALNDEGAARIFDRIVRE